MPFMSCGLSVGRAVCFFIFGGLFIEDRKRCYSGIIKKLFKPSAVFFKLRKKRLPGIIGNIKRSENSRGNSIDALIGKLPSEPPKDTAEVIDRLEPLPGKGVLDLQAE